MASDAAERTRSNIWDDYVVPGDTRQGQLERTSVINLFRECMARECCRTFRGYAMIASSRQSNISRRQLSASLAS